MNQINQINNEILLTYGEVCQNLDNALDNYAKIKKKEYFLDLLPMFYNDFNNTNDKIIFVGINPSFSMTAHKSIDIDVFKYSLFKSKTNDQKIKIIDELIKIQEGFIFGNHRNIKQIQYFKQLDIFSQAIGHKDCWLHFDLFPNRCTDQNVFTSVIMQNEFRNYRQICINRFYKLITDKNFKAVFVLNKASTLFILDNLKNLKKIRQFKEFRNQSYGVYHLNQVPFIFFKQLSQGATSKDELKLFIDITKSYLQL